jgi:hypothetical protein
MSVREARCGWEGKPERLTMRTCYRHRQYTMGSGNSLSTPGAYVLDNTQLSIVLNSDKEYNTVHCYHNYYYSNYGEEHVGKGLTSPFMQITHHENRAIVLFSIPDKDPYPDSGRREWIHHRKAHLDNLIKSGQIRYPADIDQVEILGEWWFLREDGVYVGIRPFGGEVDTEAGGGGGFVMLVNRGSRVGFVLHVGTAAEHGSFRAFREALQEETVTADMDALDVTYRCEEGTLRLKYNQGGEGLGCSVPESWIDGAKVDYGDWPTMESPVVNVVDRVLVAECDGKRYEVDWRERIPVINSR